MHLKTRFANNLSFKYERKGKDKWLKNIKSLKCNEESLSCLKWVRVPF